MRLLSWLLCAAAAIVPVITSEEKTISRPKRDSSDKKIVCYYTNWSVYRPGTAKFTPQNINPYLCTHLIYAFGGLSKENALKPFDKYQDIEQGGYAKFNGLKTYNKNLKTMLAIGGWNEGSARFSPLVADAERRKELVKNTVKFLRQNHFDGLDLDWEYPSFRDGGKPRDRDNYATLVQEFREEFERESEKTGRPRLLLTMAVPAGIEYIDKGYDVPKLNKYLDWMNILSYDYHSAFEPAINHHSPLFSLEEDDEYNFDSQLNIDHTIQHYIKLGADRSKLVLGIPTYGRSYTLFNPDATDIGSPADGPGEQGEATREKGYLAYYEICERVKSGGWTLENPNPEAMGPYAYKDNQWVGYDDEDIARAKAKYVNDNDLGGIMFWSIDNDDFRGKCHGKPYPLIEAAKEALLANANELVPSVRSGSSRSNSKKQEEETSTKAKTRKPRPRIKSSTTTESSKSKATGRTTTTPQPPTTPDPGSDFVCKDEGFFPHPRDCKKYFWCLDSGPSSLGIVAHQFTCPSGLVFNKISDSCDYARNVICKTKSEAATTTTTTTTTTTSRTTTARSRLVITASPPRTTSTTTTTTTEQPDEEEDPEEDEEDPGTIKELINLIKKLGGVEQLEKQLNIQSSDGKEKIKPSLYSRVLQGRTANRYRGINEEPSTPKYVSVFRNRPVGPQSPSTEEISTTSRGSDKPRYVTIQRNRPTKRPSKVDEEADDDNEEEVEEEQERPKQKEETSRPFRRRPVTDATTEKEYVVLRRSRPQKEEDVTTPKYKNIVRVRSTTEAAVEEEEGEEEEEEEDAPSKEEEDVEEEQQEEEIEPGQKLKKYSAIIRDNKKVLTEEEESKVSGPQGPQYESGVSSSTTDSILDGINNVNNVNTVTSPRYVEIRRTQPTSTEPSGNDVNSVNNDTEGKDEINEVSLSEIEPRENSESGFQRRITTEIVRRPIFRSSTLERTTPLAVESVNTDAEAPRFRGRFRSNPTTESTSTTETKPINRYRTLNRSNLEKPVLEEESTPNRSPKRERTFRSSTTTTTTTTTENTPNGGARRFQFAPRTKPTIFSAKPLDSTTEVFTITVPDLPNPIPIENNSGVSEFPSATLEPTTVTEPSIVDSTILDEPKNDLVITTVGGRRSQFPRQSIPTTSTETTVVTSITESSFTERRRISVPKKTRYKPGLNSKLTTTEEPSETTKPYYSPPGYRTIFRSTTPKTETTTEARRRRFKSKSTPSTTTTTEEPLREKKYVPKKTKTFKKVVTPGIPEVTSTTTERFRFQPRNRPRQAEGGPSEPENSLYLRFNTARRKKNFPRKEEDDLEVEQTATFFDDEFDNGDRYILGGSLKQTSEKDFLNADVFFRTVPTVEEEERTGNKPEEELTNSLELTKITVTPSYPSNQVTADAKEPVRNKFTINPSLRNLRTRTRQPLESRQTTEPTTATQSSRANEVTRNNFRGFRNRTTGAAALRATKGRTDSSTQEPDTKTNSNLRRPTARFSPRTTEDKEVEEVPEGGFGTRAPGRFNSYTPNPNLPNFRNARVRAQQSLKSTNDETVPPVDLNIIDEGKVEQPGITPGKFGGRTRVFSRTTEPTVSSTQEQNLKILRARTRLFKEKAEEVTQSSVYVSPTSTKETFLKDTKNSTKEEATLSSPIITTSTKEPSSSNFAVASSEGTNVDTTGTQVIGETDSTISLSLGTTVGSTFGTKIGSTSGSTVAVSSNIRSTASPGFIGRTREGIRGTYITVAPTSLKTLNTKTQSSTEPTSPETTSPGSTFRNFKTRPRQNATILPTNSSAEVVASTGSSQTNLRPRTRGKVKAIDSIFQASEGSVLEEATDSENTIGRNVFPKGRRRVLVKARPVQPAPEAKEEENELEPSEEPSSTSRTASSKRVNQDYFTNLRTRGRSTTQAPKTSERSERRRVQVDRRRFRPEVRTTTLKPEVQTENSSPASRSNVLLRRRIRPTTSTTTTTTEEPYVEQQEDSRLEESKSLDETPDIQDLADPAVVAIHNLATVSPGPIPSAVTASLNPFSQTPATYTVHVTPSDIASFSTPKIASVTPGSVPPRPTSILTLKPFTVPLITKQYIAKQTPAPFRTVSPSASPFRATGIPAVTEEPYSPRGEILIQSRRQEGVPKAKTVAAIPPVTVQKEAAPKPRKLKPFSKVPKQEVTQSVSTPEPPVDYEYYDDDEDPLANIPASALKVKVHSDGYIECLDRGNFPHPFSCKKFISCAKMENNELLGWEYTCPKHLSFDPVGGICNWSAGLGCQH